MVIEHSKKYDLDLFIIHFILQNKHSILHGNLSEAEASMIDMAERDSNMVKKIIFQYFSL